MKSLSTAVRSTFRQEERSMKSLSTAASRISTARRVTLTLWKFCG